MEFSAFFIFVVCTTSMTCLTFGKERERAMLFPDYYFFAKRRLENYTIETRTVKNLADCELMCYLNDNCVSLNFKKGPDNNDPVHICELNNVTHLKYDLDLTTDDNFYYRGSKNACDKSSHCQNNATCQSGFTLKGYRCLCPPGFEGDRCENDTDECVTTPRICHVSATCNNTHGSYVCTCKPGNTGDGQNCTDVDECKGNHPCHKNASCKNTIGSHVCKCNFGFTGNGHDCTDIDECKINVCHHNAFCTNTQGSYNCTCSPGYIADGLNCKADPCYHYKNLSEANRKVRATGNLYLCDSTLEEGWYRFVGPAGSKMPTTRVPNGRCNTDWSGWLVGAHPTVEDGEVEKMVCFSDRSTGCKYGKEISVKNCGSYFIYKLYPPSCTSRYCSTD